MNGSSAFADFRLDLPLIGALLGKPDRALVIVDAKQADFPLIFVSDTFSQIFGYDKEEAIGRNFSFLLRGELYQDGLKAVCQAVENKTSCVTSLKIYCKDDTMILGEVSSSPVLDDKGEVLYVVCLYQGAVVPD